ncbi:MAG: leucine-rich repeat domain-containing protein [Muribaculaceae bacterium]|nr:leucine-rich repeat domain-containing protein [Muribaculaceae bacterium]
MTVKGATQSITINELRYIINIESGVATITGYSKPIADLVIPKSIEYNQKEYPVTSIGSSAFRGNGGLTSVTIPNTVISIGNYAFDGCTSIKEIKIEDGDENLSFGYGLNGLFYDCPIEKLYLGRNFSYTSYSPFSGKTSLTELTIGYSVTTISEYAFSGCGGLTSVTIPNSVTSIGVSAFSDCGGLTSVTIPNSVTSIGNSAFEDCYGLTSVTIPNSVTSIANGAFYRCTKIKEITFEDGDKIISLGYGSSFSSSQGLFYDCPLEKLYLGRNISYDNNSPFSGKTGLKELTISNSVTSIGNGAFNGCTAIKEITFEDGDETLSLGNYYYNSSSTSGRGLFYDCPIEKLYLGRNLTYNSGSSYGYSPFYEKTNLTELTIGNSVTSISDYAFNGFSGLTSVTIPNSVTSIGSSAFYGCSGLTSVTIPNSVTSISGYAFYGCSGLTAVSIGNSVTSIGNSAFYGCSGLTAVNITDIASWCNISFGYYDANPLYYAHNLYLNEEKVENLIIPETVRSIKDYVFYGCSGLTSVTIPNSVTSIGNNAFEGCFAIKEITFEDGEGSLSLGYNKYDRNSIGKGLFYDCSIEKLSLGRNLEYRTGASYGYSPFYGKTNLTELTIGNLVTSIGSFAFRGCSSLTSITIPNSVTSVTDHAFYGCSAIKEIIIEDGKETLSLGYNEHGGNYSLGQGLFHDCPIEKLYLGRNLSYYSNYSSGYSPFRSQGRITELTIGNSVTEIGAYAFNYCSGLTSVTIPNSVTVIGNYAFSGCGSIKEIKLEDGEEILSLGCGGSDSLTKGLFYDCPLEKLYLGRNLSYDTDGRYGYSPFYGKTKLTELTISSSVTSIPANLLKGYSELTSLTIPNSVTSIGESAFEGCNWLTSITIPNSVTSIGGSAFEGCSAIKEIIFEDGEKTLSLGYNYYSSSSFSLGHGLFYDCPIEKLYLGRNLSYKTGSSYGYSPFYGKTTLNNLILGKLVSQIGSNCFSDCSSLKEFRTKSYSIGGLDNSGLSATNILAIITPDELNRDEVDKISNTNLTYFDNLVVENEGKNYALVTSPDYIEISGCLEKGLTMQLIDNGNEAVAKVDEKSIVNAYFNCKNIRNEICGSGFKFSPSSVWKENVFDIYATSNAGGNYRHVTMKQAGSLFDELGLQDIQSLKHLKITGDINGTDVMTINRMVALKYLDLSDANIVEGGVTYRENLKTQNNIVGTQFFSDIDVS